MVKRVATGPHFPGPARKELGPDLGPVATLGHGIGRLRRDQGKLARRHPNLFPQELENSFLLIKI